MLVSIQKPGEYFFKGEDLGELRDYYGNLLYTSIATENGVVLYQTASLNIIEDGPMIAYAAIRRDADLIFAELFHQNCFIQFL